MVDFDTVLKAMIILITNYNLITCIVYYKLRFWFIEYWKVIIYKYLINCVNIWVYNLFDITYFFNYGIKFVIQNIDQPLIFVLHFDTDTVINYHEYSYICDSLTR